MGSMSIKALHPTTYKTLGTWNTFKFLQIRSEIGKPGYYQLILDGQDTEFDNLVLDSVMMFTRTPNDGMPYEEFHGLHRTKVKAQFSTGLSQYSSFGRGVLDLLARRIVACPAGVNLVPGADHLPINPTGGYIDNMHIDTAILSLVDRHAGNSAVTAMGRLAEGRTGRTQTTGIPFIAYARSPGSTPETGPLWTGETAFRNLLDVISELAEASWILDGVPWEYEMWYSTFTASPQPGKFSFTVNEGGLGRDKSLGNPDGNKPVIFSNSKGNIQDVWMSYTRSEEINRIYALGNTTGEEPDQVRNVEIMTDTSKIPVIHGGDSDMDTSVFNLIEASRDAGSETSTAALRSFGAAELWNNKAEPHATFIPLQHGPYLYGRDYFLGDKITVIHEDFTVNLRIVAVELMYDADGVENIKLEFSDKPGGISAQYYSLNPDDTVTSVEGDISLIYRILEDNRRRNRREISH